MVQQQSYLKMVRYRYDLHRVKSFSFFINFSYTFFRKAIKKCVNYYDTNRNMCTDSASMLDSSIVYNNLGHLQLILAENRPNDKEGLDLAADSFKKAVKLQQGILHDKDPLYLSLTKNLQKCQSLQRHSEETPFVRTLTAVNEALSADYENIKSSSEEMWC